MTRLNERSRVPEVDAVARERLGNGLDREGVIAAMLIGSHARGDAHPLSDVDIAVWHQPDLDASQRLRLQLDLVAAAEAALHTDQIDLVLLNKAPPLLQQRAIRDAVRLVERDRDQRVRLETRAMLEYLDTEPLRAVLKEGLKNRIREGRFGRR